MSNKRCVNANVSSTPLSSEEREKIQCLHVVPEKHSHGNFSAGVWKYFGQLVFRTPNTCIGDNDDNNPSSLTSSQSTSTKETVIDQNSRYCGVCLDREKSLYDSDKSGRKGHISRVAKYSRNTATGSLSGHLFTAHNIDVRSSSTGSGIASARRQMSMEDVLSAAGSKAQSGTIKPAASSYEYNR